MTCDVYFRDSTGLVAITVLMDDAVPLAFA